MVRQYPTYTVAGVDMDDPSGRWELIPGTSLLPAFPGFRVDKYTVPGMVGDRSAAYAPGESTTFSIKVRFNAVADVQGTRVTGLKERVRAITANIDLFMQSTALARSGYLGLVEVKRMLSADAADHRVCSARIISSSTPEFTPEHDYAEMTFLYENHTGVWRSPKVDVTPLRTRAGKTSGVDIPVGTAPINNAFIALKGPIAGNSVRIAINNGHTDQGFRIGMMGKWITVTNTQWLVINTLNWTCGVTPILTASPNEPNWGCSKPWSGYLEPQGRPMGSALTILPEPNGKGRVHVYDPGARDVLIRTTKTWY